MAVNVGVTVSLDGLDNTGKAFQSAGDHAKRMQAEVVRIKASWQSTVTAISTALLAIKAVMGPVVDALKEPIHAALATDKAINKLNKTIMATGLAGSEGASGLAEYIDQQEILLGVDDTVIAGIINQNIAFGMNVKQAKLATEAAAALAKVTGGDLESANQVLLQSVNAQTKGLAKYVPAVNGLTDAQLRQGEGITKVIEKLGYLNKMKVSDPSTAVSRSAMMWDNMKKSIGQAMLAGVDWSVVFERVKGAIERIVKAVDDNKESIGKFAKMMVDNGVSALETFASGIEKLAPRLDALTNSLQKLADVFIILAVAIANTVLGFAALGAMLLGEKDAYTSIYNLMANFHNAFKSASLDLLGFKKLYEDTTKVLKEPVKIKLETTGKTDTLKSVVSDLKTPQAKTSKTVGVTDGFKDQMSKMAEEQRASTARQKESWKKFVFFVKSIFVGVPKTEETLAAIPSETKTGAETTKPTEKPTATKNEKFSNKALSVDQADIDKRKQLLDAIDALEKDGTSKIETTKIKSLNDIRKIEDDANRLGVQRQKDFSSARILVEKNYSKARLEVERSISEMIGDENKSRQIDQMRRMDELLNLQKERGDSSVEMKQTEQDELKTLQEKFDKERLDATRKTEMEYLDIIGNTYAKQLLETEIAQSKLKEMYNNGSFGTPGSKEAVDKYEHGKGQVDQQRDVARNSTSQGVYNKVYGTTVDPNTVQKLDNVMKDGMKVADAFQGGATSIINAVGSLWGPVGALIASIVNFLRMTPEQFRQFIDELNQAALTLIQNIVQNIGTLINQLLIAVPDIMAAIIGQLFSIGTWVKLGEAIVTGIKYMLQGVWYWLTHIGGGDRGQSVREKQMADEAKKKAEAAKAAAGEVKFGSDLADQGDNKFKIKDVTAKKAGSAGSLALIQEELPKVTEEASRTFVDDLLDGMKQVAKIFADIWGMFKDYVLAPLEQIWNLFTGLLKDIWTAVSKLSIKDVLEPFKEVGNFLGDIGKSIGSELMKFAKDPLGTLSDLVGSMKEFAKNPFKFLSNIVDKMGKFTMSRLPFLEPVVNGLKDFIKDPLNTLLDAGDRLRSFMLDKLPFLKPIADAFGSFQNWKHEMLGKISDGLTSFVHANFPQLDHAAQVLGQCLTNPIQSLKDASTYITTNLQAAGDYVGNLITSASTSFWNMVSDAGNLFNAGVQAVGDYFSSKLSTQQFMQDFVKIGTDFYTSIDTGVTNFYHGVLKAGSDLWNGLTTNINNAGPMFAAIGAKIWDGLATSAKAAWEWLGTMGNKIWSGLWSGIVGAWEWFASAGSKIWSGFWSGFINAWEWFSSAGAKLWSGFWTGLVNAWDWFSNVGGKIWNGLKDGITGAWDWFKGIGSKIWEGLSGGLSKIGGGGGGGTLGQITKALGFARGGDVTHSMKGSNLVPIFSAMGALRAQDGIHAVPGVGISDTVPILARAGERVLTPQQARSMDAGGNVTLNISINVAAGSSAPNKNDIKEMGEKIIEYLRRESKNGRNILRPSGVY